MSRKLVVIAALLATLALPAEASAAPGHGYGRGHVVHGRGHLGYAGRWHGGPRRFWGGRWWSYGVGPCWRWDPYYGRWVWVCY